MRVVSGSLTNGRSNRCSACRQKAHRKTDGAFLELLRRYKFNAAKRDLVFELTQEEFKVLVTQNCFYCGEEPKQSMHTHVIRFYYNGIDRLINEIGYTKQNSVSCCGPCNDAKGTMSAQQFLILVSKIVKHREKSLEAL